MEKQRTGAGTPGGEGKGETGLPETDSQLGEAGRRGPRAEPEFSKPDWVWRDGELIAWESATIHVMSHVVHYGSSVFEGIRCYRTPEGPAIFRLDAHLRRLLDSCRIYRMAPAPSAEELQAACVELVRANELDECYIRPIVLRGLGTVGLDPRPSPLETWIICWPWGPYLGEEAIERGVDACVSSWRRPAPSTFPPLAKAGGNYVNAALMKMEAVTNGYAEAIGLSPDGLVSEGSGHNIFVVRDGVLWTPPLDGTLLAGITRDCLITLAAALDIEVRERPVPRELLYTADELFFAGTAAEVAPIRSVDRILVGNGTVGPVTSRLQRELLAIACGEAEDVHGWRTPVRTTAPA